MVRPAAAAVMSRRSFLRAFRAATRATPAAWVGSRRLDEARRMLETTDLRIDRIATDGGFGNPVTLRQDSAQAFGSTPSGYRSRSGAVRAIGMAGEERALPRG